METVASTLTVEELDHLITKGSQYFRIRKKPKHSFLEFRRNLDNEDWRKVRIATFVQNMHIYIQDRNVCITYEPGNTMLINVWLKLREIITQLSSSSLKSCDSMFIYYKMYHDSDTIMKTHAFINRQKHAISVSLVREYAKYGFGAVIDLSYCDDKYEPIARFDIIDMVTYREKECDEKALALLRSVTQMHK